MLLYVGNLNLNLSGDDLKSVFERYGQVKSVNIVTDQVTGKSKGFAYVEMSNNQDAELAKSELNGTDLDGKSLRVNYANQ